MVPTVGAEAGHEVGAARVRGGVRQRVRPTEPRVEGPGAVQAGGRSAAVVGGGAQLGVARDALGVFHAVRVPGVPREPRSPASAHVRRHHKQPVKERASASVLVSR